MTSLAERRQRFHELHRSGCFVIPNPWDIGSARMLARLGFPAGKNKTVSTQMCGDRAVRVRIDRISGPGAFHLTLSRP